MFIKFDINLKLFNMSMRYIKINNYELLSNELTLIYLIYLLNNFLLMSKFIHFL